MADQEAVWAETTDGGLLKQLFGYYPTLHDAVLLSINIDRAADSVEIVVDYNDMLGDDHTQHLSVRIRLEWHGIDSMDLPLDCRDFYDLQFSRKGHQILTTIGTDSGQISVVSDSVEAILVRLDPGDHDDGPQLRYR